MNDSHEKKDLKGEVTDRVLSHNYDGIQEYDNPLPNWWLVTFLGAIIFGFIYWVHYQFGGGLTLVQELELKQSERAKMLAALEASRPVKVLNEDELKELFSSEFIKTGEAVFIAKCAACHAADGGGLVGPNLTDQFWLHGKGTRQDIVQILKTGVIEKGMPAWEAALTKNELLAAAGFVFSLQGQKPLKPKEPQGLEVAP